MKIAISGKGGVGKTTIMAMLAAHLKKLGKDVLIIDADTSPHMAQTIGIDNTGAITPIADMKDLLVERSGKTEGSPFYNINPQVDDIMAKFMMEKDGMKLMVLGAIETGNSGCACAENTVLKRLLTKLLLSPSQVILIDMEAGVEHLGRGTLVGIDHLLVVVIPAKSSARTGLKIKKLAHDVKIKSVFFVGNKIEDKDDENFLALELGESPIAFFPDSTIIRKAERRAEPVTGVIESVSEPLSRITLALGLK